MLFYAFLIYTPGHPGVFRGRKFFNVVATKKGCLGVISNPQTTSTIVTFFIGWLGVIRVGQRCTKKFRWLRVVRG